MIEYNSVKQVQSINFLGQSLKDILNNTILWAVPKKRRTIEKRLCRRFGIPELHWKPHVPKTNILMCRKCGHDYEAGTLCGKIYNLYIYIIIFINIIYNNYYLLIKLYLRIIILLLFFLICRILL